MNETMNMQTPFAAYDSGAGTLTVARKTLVDAILESKRTAGLCESEFELTPHGGHEFKCQGDGFVFKEVWYGGDFEFAVSEVLSAKFDSGRIIPVWFMEARGWRTGNYGEADVPDPALVISALGEALGKPSLKFPSRGPLAPKGVELDGHPGFVYYNRVNPRSSSKGFFAEGAEEIHYNGKKVYRGKWRYGLLRAERANSIVLVGEMPREETKLRRG